MTAPNVSCSSRRLFQCRLQPRRRVGQVAQADRRLREEHRRQAGRAEERLGPDRPAEEEVVVEVEPVLGQAGDVVQRGLDRVGVEGRQRVGRHDLVVRHHLDAGVVELEPGGHLAAGDEVDVAHPRREQVDRTKRVAQLVAGDEPGPAAGLAGAGGALHRGDAGLAGGVPPGVVAVDPGVDDVDGEAALVDGRRGHQRQGAHLDAVDDVRARAGSRPGSCWCSGWVAGRRASRRRAAPRTAPRPSSPGRPRWSARRPPATARRTAAASSRAAGRRRGTEIAPRRSGQPYSAGSRRQR